MKGLNKNSFYRLLEWVMWLAFINLLWFAGTLLGLILFGAFPATVAMFTVVRQLILEGATGKQIVKKFIVTYKNEFIKSNVIGLIMVITGYLLYLDFIYIRNFTGITYYIFYTGLVFASIIYIISSIYIFPVLVHYDLKLLQYFKNAIVIGIISPIFTVIIGLGLFCLYYLLTVIPGLIPLITMSTIALIIMSCALIIFRRLEDKQQSIQNHT
ncbi:YesL family protein [Metabacillus malikii]|uniref:Membrane protein YesL n=1 Tax=Metabacillus malikii TaxID=1504265 RepID=A0ABT9ZFX2_9BACI|nr:DUF624 domain-containing protein [Metabacillus malikii]MDQ0231178.1 putative membrane protein YesL [Metabacillus malikii]